MARISFRQGIVSHQLSGTSQAFLYVNGAYVDLVVSPDPTIITFIHGDVDYLYTESSSITNAWGPFTTATAWLYWNLDLLTGQVNRGFTDLEPKESSAAPNAPAVGQMWFNTLTRKWSTWIGSGWREVVRVFAARLETGNTLRSMSINAPLSFRGTQVGLATPTRAGAVVFTDNGLPVRANGRLFTTEDQFLTGVPTGASLRVANIIVTGEAQVPLAAYQVVQYNDFNKIGAASPYTQGLRLFGIIEEDAITGEVINFITEGMVFNEDWDWVAAGASANTPVYINPTGEITLNQAIPNARPVGLVTGRQEILFAPQLFPQVTVVGGGGGGGATALQIAQINQNTADAATAQGTANAAVIRAGDTMTGLLTLSADPTALLHAATKQYVDANTASGKVDKAGDIMTGSLTINTANADIILQGFDVYDNSEPTIELINGARLHMVDGCIDIDGNNLININDGNDIDMYGGGSIFLYNGGGVELAGAGGNGLRVFDGNSASFYAGATGVFTGRTVVVNTTGIQLKSDGGTDPTIRFNSTDNGTAPGMEWNSAAFTKLAGIRFDADDSQDLIIERQSTRLSIRTNEVSLNSKMKTNATVDGDDDFTVTTKGYVDGIPKLLPFSFNGVLPDTTLVAQFIFPGDYTLTSADNVAAAATAPSGGTGTFNLKKNGVVFGSINWLDGATTGTIILSNTTFVSGDILSIETTAINGMSDPVITFTITST